MKKIVSKAFLVFLFAAAALLVYSAEVRAEHTIETENASLYPFYASLDNNQKAVYIQLLNAIEELEETVNLTNKLTTNQTGDMLVGIAYDHPELFWYGYIDINGFGFRNASGGMVYQVVLNFNKYARNDAGELSKEALAANVKKVEDAADAILALTAGMPDYEVERFLHDQLCMDLSYDWESYLFEPTGTVDLGSSEGRKDLTIYNFLVQKKCICAGYARSFQYLLSRAGIPCYYCVGEAYIRIKLPDGNGGETEYITNGTHAWNVVKIQGNYYGVDITWDDLYGETDSDGNKLDFNRINYSYYNMTQNQLNGDGDSGHTLSSTCKGIPQCASTDSFNSLYGETRTDAYLEKLEAMTYGAVKSFDELKNLTKNYFQKFGGGSYVIPMVDTNGMSLINSVINKLTDRTENANFHTEIKNSWIGNQTYSGFGAWAGLWYYPLEMNVYYFNFKITQEINKSTTDLVDTSSYPLQLKNPVDGIKTGLDGKMHYFAKGLWQQNYTGYADYSGKKWYVVNGTVDTSFTGFLDNGFYIMYFKNGAFATDVTDILKDTDGTWYYVKNGYAAVSFTGFADRVSGSGGRWRIENGKINFSYNGVVFESNQWRYYTGGKWQNTYNGTQTVGCKKYVFKNGVGTVSGAHTPAAAVEENRIEPYCTASGSSDGSYDSVVYCSACGEELSRNTIIIPVAHTPATAVRENITPSTCTVKGHYDSVVYCSICGKELSRKNETLPLDTGNHNPAAAVQENRIEATCKSTGSYDRVIYCSRCGKELSRVTVTIPIDSENHAPAAAVIENEIPATDDENGSYDSVIYCSRCGQELSRVNTETPATGTKIVSENGQQRYYYKGVWQKNFSGYVNTNGDKKLIYQWKIVNGVVDESYEGLYKVDGVWRYYRYGKFQDTITGFATDMTRFNASGRKQIYRYRVEKGLINFKFSGMAETGNTRYYEDGRWMNTYTGYCNDRQGLSTRYEFYVKNGVIDNNYEGLYKVEGVWRYYRYGKFQDTTTGFATDMTRFNAGQGLFRYRVEKGLINFHFTGLAESGNKRYYKDGRWMNTFTGTVVIDGKSYNIKQGVVV